MYYVYFVAQKQKRGLEPIKIGFTKNPKYRLKALQVGNPNKLEMITKIPFETMEEAAEVERTLHYLAGRQHKQLVGEWFLIYGSIQKLLEEAQKIYEGNKKAK